MKWQFDPKLLALLFLGISCGLPYVLIMATMTVWLSEYGLTKSTIGLFALVGTPFTFKFLWSPLLEGFNPPFLQRFLGHRKGWLILIQLGLMVTISLLSLLNPMEHLLEMAFLCVLIAFLAASQDILVDGLRIEILKPELFGLGGSIEVLGYRLGMVISGAGALYLATAFGWTLSYQLMAIVLIIGILTSLLLPRETLKVEKPAPLIQRLTHSFIQPFLNFTTHSRWYLALLFIALFTLNETLLSRMSNPFYLSLGFTKDDIASASKLFGVLATITGGLVGGALITKLGIIRSLVLFSLSHLIANCMFLVLFYVGYSMPTFYLAVGIENLTLGMMLASLVAYISGLCSLEFSKTQYALLSSLGAFSRIIIASFSGIMVDTIGWMPFFYVSMFLGLPALALIRFLPLGRFAQEWKKETG